MNPRSGKKGKEREEKREGKEIKLKWYPKLFQKENLKNKKQRKARKAQINQAIEEESVMEKNKKKESVGVYTPFLDKATAC